MNQHSLIKKILFLAAIVIAILVPCLTLFQEEDWLYYVIRDSSMQKAWAETLLAAVILAAGMILVPKRRFLLILSALVLGIAAFAHSMLLPLLTAGLWFFVLMMTGDLLFSISLVIILAAVLSFAGLCTPLILAVTVVAVIAVYTLCVRVHVLKQWKLDLQRFCLDDSPLSIWFMAGFFTVVLVIFVQIARANQCIDYDSLWYGVRGAYVLCPGGSIFEDLGLVGMVYTYSKGFEILTLPFSLLPSYTGWSAFNMFLFLSGLYESGRIGNLFDESQGKNLAVLLTALVPGIVNMTLSAKPDIITWLLQLMMLRRFFETVKKGPALQARDRKLAALEVTAAYLISLTMKPTALVFSTALYGMMLLWTLGRMIQKKRSDREASGSEKADCETEAKGNEKAVREAEASKSDKAFRKTDTSGNDRKDRKAADAEKEELLGAIRLIFSVLALAAVWGRTMKLTGLPFTSVFTGILERLGFTLKYPFSSRALPTTWQEGSQLLVAIKRLGKMLLAPEGKDMSHVLIAWGGSMFFVLFAVLIIGAVLRLIEGLKTRTASKKETGKLNANGLLRRSALTVLLPFLLVCFITLMMLYQVDGNYYMTAYSAIILLVCLVLSKNNRIENGMKWPVFKAASFGMFLFQFMIMTMTNWAGSTGFFPIRDNFGLLDHKAYYREMLSPADGSIYEILEEDRKTRAVAFGEHPICLQYPCVVQSYNDITSPWGNVELVNSADAMIEYLHFAGVDYVVAEKEHLDKPEWSWSKGLLEEMIEKGALTDLHYEGENWIAKVR